MGGNNSEWDGTTERRGNDRREGDFARNGPLAELYYRVGDNEKKIDRIEDKVDDLVIGYTTLKIEMSNVAKEEGKASGIIYGVGGAIFTAIIIKLIENGMGG